MVASNTLNLQGGIPLPSVIETQSLPSLVTAWASIVPLASHLATAAHSHQLVGQIALNGRLSIDLCPRLGFYKQIYNLLSAGQSFYDEASSKAGLSMTVFDVHWGSVFPIANGDAFKKIVEFARSRSRVPVMFEEKPLESNPVKEGFRRYQTLHVQRFIKKRRPRKRSIQNTLWNLKESGLFPILGVILRIGLVTVFCLIGCYGTAGMVACTLLASAVGYCVHFKRPMSFLKNNETHDGYMLAACHANASEWFLLTGDRGVVDCLVNKPMVTLDPSKWLAVCFILAESIQLASMTLVTAVQGLDGFCMTLLILCARLIQWAYSRDALVAEWLHRDEIAVSSTKIVFSGRTQMLGAIYMSSSEETTAWLDPILVDNPRRRVWLDQLRAKKQGHPILQEGTADHLSRHDREWVDAVTHRSQLGGSLLRTALEQLSASLP